MWASAILNFLLQSTVPFESTQNTSTFDDSKTMQVKEMACCDDIVIFTKSYCSYCKMAMKILDECGATYTEIILDRRADGEEIQKILGELTGCRTVPRIFVNRSCLGGCAECKKLYETGELQKLLFSKQETST